MKELLKKFFRSKYFPHAVVIPVLVIFTVMGWMTALAVLYIGYLLYLFAKLIGLIVRDTKSRLFKYFFAFVLCFGLAPGFAIGLLPLWFVSVVYLQNNPEIKQNVPEYKTRNTTLRNATNTITNTISTTFFQKVCQLVSTTASPKQPQSLTGLVSAI